MLYRAVAILEKACKYIYCYSIFFPTSSNHFTNNTITSFLFISSYFADCVGKSAGYCSFNDQNVGLLLLCEVALGNPMTVTQPQYITQLENGIHSLKCNGRWSVSGFKQRSDGLLIPDGCLKRQDKTLTMRYNEFIVYNEAQVRIKYLVMVGKEHHNTV